MSGINNLGGSNFSHLSNIASNTPATHLEQARTAEATKSASTGHAPISAAHLHQALANVMGNTQGAKAGGLGSVSRPRQATAVKGQSNGRPRVSEEATHNALMNFFKPAGTVR